MSPRSLTILAGLVWLIAGVNVCRIGSQAWSELGVGASPLLIGGVAATFLPFAMMFGKITTKNIRRIYALPTEQRKWWRMMTAKSYATMVFMIALGATLRHCSLVPTEFIAAFYVGLGAALTMAGLAYFVAR